MFRGLVAILNFIAVVALLFSAYSSYINPNSIWQFSFAGLIFPVLAIVNLFFILWWMMQKRWFALLSIVAVLLCYKQVRASFAFNFSQNKKAEKSVKVMSWNVKNFDLYNWTGNAETRNKMLLLIQKEAPDILCMQEFYTNNSATMNNIRYFKDSLAYLYFHFEPSVKITKKQKGIELEQQWGEATFSKFPIQNKGRIAFQNTLANDCIYTDILLSGEVLRILNMHLQSIRLDEKDYDAIQQMEATQTPDWMPLKRIAKKMKYSYKNRASQVEQVAKTVRKYSGKQIVCADLNDVPVSYTYRTLLGANQLKDAFTERGLGIGPTFVSAYSFFRIDYILASHEISVLDYHSPKEQLSDHYPVIANIQIKQ